MPVGPIKHEVVVHDYYRVETRDGKHRWLAVPAGTPTKVVATPARPTPRATVLAAA